MKNGKAPGPTGQSSDLMKKAGIIVELMRIFRGIHEKWKNRLTVAIYKGKGDEYRGITLLAHRMTLFEKVLEEMLRKLIKVDDRQFGFRSGRSTIDAIFIMLQIQEKFNEKKKKLFHIFVDLEKAFDRVPKGGIMWALRRKKVT